MAWLEMICPRVEDYLNDEFKEYILSFAKKNLPDIYSLLGKYKNNRNIIIFKSREEAEHFISNCK